MKRKIAILGGGMAALSAAFDLTRTQALRDQFDVTIYQMGWRLGGKAASGRDCEGRIVEHGLHVWFGCYENAFELVRAAYAAWDPQKDQAITEVKDAFEAQAWTAMGSGDTAQFFALDWPELPGQPGDGSGSLALWPCVRNMLEVIRHQFDLLNERAGIEPRKVNFPLDILVLLRIANVIIPNPFGFENGDAGRPEAAHSYRLEFAKSLFVAADWADKMAQNPSLRNEVQLRGFVRQLRTISESAAGSPTFLEDPVGGFLAQLLDVGTAVIKGVVLDMELGGASVSDLDREDFRDWLSSNGADRDAVYASSIVRSIYDTTMQYCEGDFRRPNFAAGTAAQVSIRLFGSYKDAFAYESCAGLGETVIAPIYRVLAARQVHFKFFHKLTGLELNAKRDAVAAVHFNKQVHLKNETYEPTIPPKPEFGNLECWPETPLWDQIENGDSLKHLDFESYWCTHSAEPVTLSEGDGFDDVILAVPIGVFKPLKDPNGPCAELIAANPAFKTMTDAAVLVPTISVQAWCTQSLADMGWPPHDLAVDYEGGPPTSTGPRPLNIWSDRTAVMKYEDWGWANPPPVTLQYLCDVFETSLYREPPNSRRVPKQALRLARKRAVEWFEEKSRFVWPKATRDGVFDWNLLFDKKKRIGKRRLRAQVVKANVDPSACCAGSPAGSTQWRLAAEGSGFGHLYLAGAWVDTGFNVECIEAAVMSGKQAARAISGSHATIVGEDFLHFERGLGALVAELFRDGEAVIEDAFGVLFGDGKGEIARRTGRTRRKRGGQGR